MAGSQARFSGWASAEPPLHAFSLPSFDVEARTGSTRGRGWFQSFGELWGEVALGDPVGRHVDPQTVGGQAKRRFDLIQRDLLALWKGSGAGRRSVLCYAAVSLECSARVWRAFGPVAGQRHLHLLHRLEQALGAAEREIRAAEQPLLVNRATIMQAANTARAAIDELLGATCDPATALATLEDAAVDLASLTVRIARHLNEIGGTRRAHVDQPVALRQQLEALAGEVRSMAHVQRSRSGEAAEEDHLGAWLRATLSIAPPVEAVELASLRRGDPGLRADALLALRARWLELTVGLWVIVQALEDLLTVGAFGDEERLRSTVSSRAGTALVASELYLRPGDFDHRHAWDRQREALSELVSDVCLALQTCDSDAVLRSQQLALRRLARALAAIWTIDEQVRSPLAKASHGSRRGQRGR
jgi:hypothetical protein